MFRSMTRSFNFLLLRALYGFFLGGTLALSLWGVAFLLERAEIYSHILVWELAVEELLERDLPTVTERVTWLVLGGPAWLMTIWVHVTAKRQGIYPELRRGGPM